ncbi:hypothetical protein, partial [Aeromonas sp. MdU4]|uniref:hypothetical protein n=1 Tax=Aeromonas sp. MdU4 TaxID=3342819 RepID=UPI0035B76A8E
MANIKPAQMVMNDAKITVITHHKKGITCLPAPFPLAKATIGVSNRLKTPKPGSMTGLWGLFWCATLWANGQIAHSKKAFPVRKAFQI